MSEKLAPVFDVTRNITQSSNIKKLAYSTEHQLLRVTFASGDAYEYSKVDPLIAGPGLTFQICDGWSVGKWFQSAIKSQGYTYEKVGKALVPDMEIAEKPEAQYLSEVAAAVKA